MTNTDTALKRKKRSWLFDDEPLEMEKRDEEAKKEEVLEANKPSGKKRGKKVAKILLIVLGCIIFVFGLLALVNVIGNNATMKLATGFEKIVYENQLVPTLDGEDWCFTTDEEFKTVQLTDVHIGGGFGSFKKDALALNAVAAMLTAEKPDLVIVTGDIAYPVPFQAGTFNNMSGTKIFSRLMETLGVYWTFAFGNHDTEMYSYYTREDIVAYYAKSGFEYCLFRPGPTDVDGFSNHVIKVQDSNGLNTQAFVILDSHSYVDGDYFGINWKYDNIHANQVEWYQEQITSLNQENSDALATLGDEELINDRATYETVKTLLFFHIPLQELKECVDAYLAKDKAAEVSEDITYIHGYLGEGGKYVYCGTKEDNLFDTAVSLGSTQGFFFGHDHLNNIAFEYKGIRLSYGMSIDYLAYSGIMYTGAQRGCTVILTQNDGSFDSYNENYYQDKYVAVKDKGKINDSDILKEEIWK